MSGQGYPLHDPRTLHLVVKAVRHIQDQHPYETTILDQRHDADLVIPDPWDFSKTIQHFEDRFDIHLSVHVQIFHTRFELYPGDPQPYIELSVSASGRIDPPPADLSGKSDKSRCWLDDRSTNAGLMIRLGPLDADRDLYLDFYLRLSP